MIVLTDFKFLTFDCYGTLVDWRSGIETALGKALGELPVSGSELLDAYVKAEAEEEGAYKKYRTVLGDTAQKLGERFGKDVQRADVEKFAASVPSWPAFSDTAEALRELGRRGYKRYILSNVDTDLLLGTIMNQNLEVDGFVTAEQTHSYKPAQGHWLAFMEKTGANKDQILHVAQSIYHDIIPTAKLDIASAWVNRYSQPLPEGVHPLFIADSMAHLSEILG